MVNTGERIGETADYVEYYAHESYIEKAEETIINLLKENLSKMKMLDIGVGGGRTTLHFAHLVNEYVGSDYDENMIYACRKRFPDFDNTVSFLPADARSMNIFEDGFFDFI